MANWAMTDYVIEGPKETLRRIQQAILHCPTLDKDPNTHWEVLILDALGVDWKNPDGTEPYLRGYIYDGPWWDNITPLIGHDVLRFTAQEAWGATEFHEVLSRCLPDIKVYYCVEEPDDAVYATNDKEGIYFHERYYIDSCIKGNYQSDYFTKEEDAYSWLSSLTDGKVKSAKDIVAFNECCDNDEDYISFHVFDIVE